LASEGLPHALRRRWEAEGAHVVDVSSGEPQDEPHGRLRETVRTWRPDVVLLDGHHLDATTDAALTLSGAPLATLDDNHERDRSRAALVINPGAHATSLDYGATPSLRGLSFALLRRELRRARSEDAPDAAHLCQAPVLVTLGGSDPRGLTAPIVEGLATRGVRVAALVGSLCAPSEALDRACALPRVERVEAVEDLVPLLSRVGWCVSAAGGTAIELSALGHPVIALATVPNQRAAACALAGPSFDLVTLRGAALARAVESICDTVVTSHRDLVTTRRLALEGAARIDGQGAARVARALAALAVKRLAA
jgi:spore coat polysaccharide biosynthesis predicted glycosyltransferase SpsG